ncbi:MAG: 3'-5' exonuclease [Bdellovibrionaceae bacterium]|nr:3'-5' exonuclease [Pseudobdellovibrionaceae bacterium]
MNRICFFDTECNSLDTSEGFIMELAWAVFDLQSKRLLHSKSSLIKWNRGYLVDPGAKEVTGLTREFCESNGQPANSVFTDFLVGLLDYKVDILAGHNILEFDLPIMRSNMNRVLFESHSQIETLLHVDTYHDLPIENPRQSMALKYLALDHGHILNSAHEALADVMASAHVFFKYPLEDVLARARTPLKVFHGYTAYQDDAARERFYRAKFRWHRINRRFEKKCRAFYLPKLNELVGQDLICDEDLNAPVVSDPQVKDNNQLELPF